MILGRHNFDIVSFLLYSVREVWFATSMQEIRQGTKISMKYKSEGLNKFLL